MKRPPDSWSSDMAVMAAMAGVRAGICMMAVPTRIFSVCASTQEADVMESLP